jgi:hypothetical protein
MHMHAVAPQQWVPFGWACQQVDAGGPATCPPVPWLGLVGPPRRCLPACLLPSSCLPARRCRTGIALTLFLPACCS